MSVDDPPLLELFTRLREADLPLGIEEYQSVLQALQAGFGISDREALKRLCRTLWIKSAEEGRLFDYHFEQLLPRPTERKKLSQVKNLLGDPALNEVSVAADISEITLSLEDEVQVAKAVSQAADLDDGIPPTHYTSSDEYFPVTRRQMKQSWRYLRRSIREGPPVELDIDATINEIGRTGMLLQPVLVPLRINHAELLLLIDQGGSMIPFHLLSRRLVDTVSRGGRLGKTSVYYFRNCPTEYLYRDPAYLEYKSIEEVLRVRDFQQAGVLVFSDAGAARGGFSQERIALTEIFLKRFKQQFPYVVWLNPLPRSRWYGTSASKIMQSVPMFDLSRRGLDAAISVLRGRHSRFASTWRQSYRE